MIEIPFSDLRAARDELSSEIDEAIARVAASGWYIGGPEVEQFEERWARYCGAQHCVGVANGFDALHLSLRALGIGSGDEVILASNSYIATVLAVTMVGATPIFVEPDPKTFNLDPLQVETAITSRTRALLPTHLYGQPADLDLLLAIAAKHRLSVVEDAAQAHGARYKGRAIGKHSDIVCWSFYPTKNLGAFGDAGAITTDNEDLARKIRIVGNYGSSSKYISEIKGVNSRLDPLQAAILTVKLKYLDEWNRRRAAVAAFYLKHLQTSVEVPSVPDWAEPAWHLFVVKHLERDKLAERLSDHGVQTLVHYPVPPHLQAAYSELGIARGAFPVAEELALKVLSLPIGPHLCREQQSRVVETVNQAAKRLF